MASGRKLSASSRLEEGFYDFFFAGILEVLGGFLGVGVALRWVGASSIVSQPPIPGKHRLELSLCRQKCGEGVEGPRTTPVNLQQAHEVQGREALPQTDGLMDVGNHQYSMGGGARKAEV